MGGGNRESQFVYSMLAGGRGVSEPDFLLKALSS